jgi:aspartate aminotransferase-like enzyme
VAVDSSVDPGGLAEFSVVFTGRALNHMSRNFQLVMRDISGLLRSVYRAEAVAVVPGGGSYGMEAIARQFAHGKRVLVIRNGWFSYRWSQIFELGGIPARETVLKARRIADVPLAPFAPPAIEDVEAAIARERPDLVFAAHVETASGILLPDTYLDRIANAVHAHGGLFVLDCIASGAVWVDMPARVPSSASNRPRAAALPPTCANGARSCRPTRTAAMPTTRPCPPTHCARSATPRRKP